MNKQEPKDIADLKENPRNPRTITARSLELLRTSLEKFGDLGGIVWNRRTGQLVTGHQRLKALKDAYGDALKIENNAIITPSGERFAIRIVDWDEEMELAANIAANSYLLHGVFTNELDSIIKELEEWNADLVKDLALDSLSWLNEPEVPEDAPATCEPSEAPLEIIIVCRSPEERQRVLERLGAPMVTTKTIRAEDLFALWAAEDGIN